MSEHSEPKDQLTEVRRLLSEATHRLLGDTISVTDEDWREPSRLPGWSRGHVASHVARQADALGRLVEWARTGQPSPMYSSDEQRNSDIEAGSGRSGLDLQIDLDTSAGRLEDGFDRLDAEDGWDAVVELRGGKQTPARLLPVARLGEVVLHHIDLDADFDVDDIESAVALWLLEWCAIRLADRGAFPSLLLEPRGGRSIHIGPTEDRPLVVRGRPARLLGWLSGRGTADGVEGADGLTLPPY